MANYKGVKMSWTYIRFLGEIEWFFRKIAFAIHKHKLICRAKMYKPYYEEFRALVKRKEPDAKTGCYIGPEAGAQRIEDVEIYFLVEGAHESFEFDKDIQKLRLKLYREAGLYGIPIRFHSDDEEEAETILLYE